MRLVQQMGYQADLASNGLEALAAIDKKSYDLIFMDVMMPEMGGLDATQEIRRRQEQPADYPNYKSPIIIVAMTANAMPGDREKCLAVGMDDYLSKPVRLEDMRSVLERWGEKAVTKITNNGSSNGIHIETQLPAPQAPISAQPTEDQPVEMERLLDFTDGNSESLRELVTLYLDQTTGQIDQMEAAIKEAKAHDVRRLAHSCAGASATCGMRRMVPLLRQLEKQGHEGKLAGAAELCDQVAREFQIVRTFLETYLASQTEVMSKTCS